MGSGQPYFNRFLFDINTLLIIFANDVISSQMKGLKFTIPVPRGKTVIVQKDVLPHFYPHLHRHEEIQLTWIQQGEGTLVAENNMYSFRSGEIYWLGVNLPHVFKSDPSYF